MVRHKDGPPKGKARPIGRAPVTLERNRVARTCPSGWSATVSRERVRVAGAQPCRWNVSEWLERNRVAGTCPCRWNVSVSAASFSIPAPSVRCPDSAHGRRLVPAHSGAGCMGIGRCLTLDQRSVTSSRGTPVSRFAVQRRRRSIGEAAWPVGPSDPDWSSRLRPVRSCCTAPQPHSRSTVRLFRSACRYVSLSARAAARRAQTSVIVSRETSDAAGDAVRTILLQAWHSAKGCTATDIPEQFSRTSPATNKPCYEQALLLTTRRFGD